MDPSEIVEKFSKSNSQKDARKFLDEEGILSFILDENETIDGRISPDFCDLARLYLTIRSRKVFTILEFGVGYSTIVMGFALKKNKQEWNEAKNKPEIRNTTPFQLHSVDASQSWIEISQKSLPSTIDEIVHFHYSKVSASRFEGRDCHYYELIPNIVPDLIYLDGPDPKDVENSKQNLGDWSNSDKVVMSGDLLRMEPWLLPGTCLIIDGRTANARFIFKHLYRNWEFQYNEKSDITVLELQEAPLGDINSKKLNYCIGNRVNTWSEN